MAVEDKVDKKRMKTPGLLKGKVKVKDRLLSVGISNNLWPGRMGKARTKSKVLTSRPQH
jgi:hypothetical protein